jgi:hypothetical protein
VPPERRRSRVAFALHATHSDDDGWVLVDAGLHRQSNAIQRWANAVIGGVTTSTLLTLLVIPATYDVPADWRARP